MDRPENMMLRQPRAPAIDSPCLANEVYRAFLDSTELFSFPHAGMPLGEARFIVDLMQMPTVVAV